MEDCNAERVSRRLCPGSNDGAHFEHEMLGVLLDFRHIGIEHLLHDVGGYVFAGVPFVLGNEGFGLVFDILFPMVRPLEKVRKERC